MYISTAWPRMSSTTGTAAASATASTMIRRRLQLLGTQAVPETLITSSTRPSIRSTHPRPACAVIGEVRPVVPVRALLVRVVLLVVQSTRTCRGRPQTVWKMPGQGARMQMLPALPLPAVTSSPFSSRILGKDTECRRTTAAGLHGVKGRQRAAEESPFSVCHHVSTIVASPLPTTSWYQRHTSGFNGLAHGRHVSEVVVILSRARRARPCAMCESSWAQCESA